MTFKHNFTKIAKTVGSSAANVATNVAKKSENLVEVSKISVNIASEEDKINDIFNEMGKMIFEEYKMGEELPQELEQKCKKVTKIQKSIEELREKIMQFKNVKRCSVCGCEMKLNVEYCPKCGARQPVLKLKLQNESKDKSND